MDHPARTVLVCDDSAVDRKLIASLLGRSPVLLVRECADGGGALRELSAGGVDLVVTDLAMPGTDGLELVRRIKSDWPGLPVVLVTGQGSEESAMEALRRGASSYTPKSALAGDLLRTVEFVLDIADHVHHHRDPALQQRGGPAGAVTESHLLDNDCRLIGPLIERLQGQMTAWPESDQLQISMALAEALTNAMHHGNLEVPSSLRCDDDARYHALIRERRAGEPWGSRRVHVTSRLGPDEITIRIHDEGPGFDLASIPDPTLPENMCRVSGRGLLLIRSFMDEVRHDDRGSTIVMTKRRSEGPA